MVWHQLPVLSRQRHSALRLCFSAAVNPRATSPFRNHLAPPWLFFPADSNRLKGGCSFSTRSSRRPCCRRAPCLPGDTRGGPCVCITSKRTCNRFAAPAMRGSHLRCRAAGSPVQAEGRALGPCLRSAYSLAFPGGSQGCSSLQPHSKAACVAPRHHSCAVHAVTLTLLRGLCPCPLMFFGGST